MERLKELIDRMVAPGDAFAQLSASEGHEIREGCMDLFTRVAELETLSGKYEVAIRRAMTGTAEEAYEILSNAIK